MSFLVTATDAIDGSDLVTFTEGGNAVHSGDLFSVGTHTVTASATDRAGNSASEQFSITVQDTTPPTLSAVTGAGQIDEATGPTGAPGLLLRRRQAITVDGNADPVIFTEGGNTVHSGDTFGVGTHTITASATDQAGNTASETFTVTVHDTTAPTLTAVTGAGQVDEATGPAGAQAVFSATASDIVDLNADIVTATEGGNTVHSGDAFGFGTHTITASATDQHGNSASETFTVTVQDTTAPALTPVSSQTDEATGPDGAVATFAASASDIVDGSDPVTFTEGDTVVHSGDTFGFNPIPSRRARPTSMATPPARPSPSGCRTRRRRC